MSLNAPAHKQDKVQDISIQDPEPFWLRHADNLHWQLKPRNAIKKNTHYLSSGISHPTWTWFPGGEINTSFNCIDRHVERGWGSNVAVIYDSPVTSTKQKITYSELLREVEFLAAALIDKCGVRKGDTVLIYLPMIPQALYAMLATSRIGGIHAVVFGGFAATSLAQRIDAAKPKVILTASCGLEGMSKIQRYRSFVRAAYDQADHKPEFVIIWDRQQCIWGEMDTSRGECSWQSLIEKMSQTNRRERGIAIRSDEGLYIIYTSGTTGTPKGVLRPAGGHAVGLQFSTHYLFGISGPGDVMFCASDVGWVVGHSYIVYAPLLVGATTVLFEGKPVGTPDAGTFWRIIDEYNVNILFTAPTALRAVRRDDPRHEFLITRGKKGALRSLRAIFLAGERSEPSLVSTYQDIIGKFGARNAQVIDNWWSSESGSPITGIAMRPGAGLDIHNQEVYRALRVKPGSAGKPMPGFDVRCVDDEGNEVTLGNMGNIVMSIPLGPTALTTLFGDEERFYRSYLKRFKGQWIDTGDAGFIDEDGFVSIMSRADDIINVAAHRFSTGSIEQAVTSHPDVAEGCVVGIPDQLKGHLPFAFVTLNATEHPNYAVPDDKLLKGVNDRIREQIGSIATLGGMIQGKGMIPKTRSGKTLRRVLRHLIENAVHGEFDKPISVPATVEDSTTIDVARSKIKEYFNERGMSRHQAIETKSSL